MRRNYRRRNSDEQPPMSSECTATGFTRALRRTSRNLPKAQYTTTIATIQKLKGEQLWDKRDSPSDCCKRPGKSSFRRVQRLPFTTLLLNALARLAETTILPSARTPASGAPYRADSNRSITRLQILQIHRNNSVEK